MALNGLNAQEYIRMSKDTFPLSILPRAKSATDDTVPMLIWSATESTVTIMCSSIPVLRPLYVRFRYGSKGDSSSGHNSSYKLPMYGNNSARKYGLGSTAGIEAKDDPSSHRTVITYNADNASDESILRDTKVQGIRRTDQVEISYTTTNT